MSLLWRATWVLRNAQKIYLADRTQENGALVGKAANLVDHVLLASARFSESHGGAEYGHELTSLSVDKQIQVVKNSLIMNLFIHRAVEPETWPHKYKMLAGDLPHDKPMYGLILWTSTMNRAIEVGYFDRETEVINLLYTAYPEAIRTSNQRWVIGDSLAFYIQHTTVGELLEDQKEG
jgi:hypothetical protein